LPNAIPSTKPRAAAPALVALVLATTHAAADPAFGADTTANVESEVGAGRRQASGDGTYGRLDGDLDLGLGLGALIDVDHGDLGAVARVSAHWFFMAGAYVSYADGLGTELDPMRRLGVGVDLRPLFLPRWTQDLERGPAILDLTLDSISLGLGASFDELEGRAFGARRAFEASLGFGVPLAGRAPGPWLEARGALAWGNLGERSETILLVGSYHFALETPLVGGD
jgi:hypothetical protein